ncbi:hypothetical protein PROFUN_05817 [Planoprotostelium fungivorum]|uniref:Uncharacterized protein n=1 Tax=Planoprotostelium fungivorum TaxID=1890364 RepID=A0A2P6NQ02_9EUKA|nr:hypothetical protein PROFUN_05817 [Planoprotostelium fungivorum]
MVGPEMYTVLMDRSEPQLQREADDSECPLKREFDSYLNCYVEFLCRRQSRIFPHTRHPAVPVFHNYSFDAERRCSVIVSPVFVAYAGNNIATLFYEQSVNAFLAVPSYSKNSRLCIHGKLTESPDSPLPSPPSTPSTLL